MTTARRSVAAGAIVVVLAAGLATATSTLAYLRPIPITGPEAVGRVTSLLVDPGRPEPRTAADDRREVRLTAWYPAVAGSGHPAAYVGDLDAIADGLVASGELDSVVVAGLRLAGTNARVDADVRPSSGAGWPILLLSPSTATNVAFYASLAEELASHGYVVVGVDHPYQVTAVELDGGRVAVYDGDPPIGDGGGGAAAGGSDMRSPVARIDERLADLRFVVDRLVAGDALPAMFRSELDLDRIGALGHSNGGIAAAELCATDPRIEACLNIDGLQAGGPFSVRANPAPPTKPFLFLTKEPSLAPPIADLFERGGTGVFRVVVPEATHDEFADGPRFQPRVLPIDGVADRVLTVSRGFAVAFFDHVLGGAPRSVLGHVEAPTDVLLEVYPLRAPSR